MKRFLLLAVMVVTGGSLFSQTNIPNGDFETWQNIGTDEEEPTNWNSNKTGGGFASLGPQTCYREATNPHSGTYCVRLSNSSFFGTAVNASFTTGKIEAPTTNPSEGFIRSVISDADFNSPFTGRPDSLVFWARFNQAGTDQAKVSVFLHGNYDYEEPDQGASAAYLIGSGTYTFPANTVSNWTRYAIPISYENGDTPSHILIIGTASDSPGIADANTSFWIDDMEAIYCSNSVTDVQVACGSYTWIDGNTYTASNNTAIHTLTNSAGCDSVVTLDLTILNPSSGTDIVSACGSFTWIDGNTYTTDNNSATHTLIGAAANGCDSIITLDLTISTFASGVDIQTACGSYTWIDGNTYTTSNNMATHTIVGGSVNGCDSVVTLNLTITPFPDNTVTLLGETISANVSGASYQWLDCNNNNAELVGQTGQSFNPTATGNYSVEVSNNGCVDTSDCVNISISKINNHSKVEYKLYPNPSTGIFNIELSNVSTNPRIEVYNLAGKIVTQQRLKSTNSVIDISSLEKGVYYLKVILSNGDQSMQKIILN